MNEVLQVYVSLQGVHPVKAEIQYMKEIQMMDGYGMEYYVAKVSCMGGKNITVVIHCAKHAG